MNSQDTERDHQRLAEELSRLYEMLQATLKSLQAEPGADFDQTQRDFINRLTSALRPAFQWGLYTGESPPRGPSPSAATALRKPRSAVLGFAFGMTIDGRSWPEQ